MAKNHKVQEFIRKPKKALFTLALPVMVGMVFQTLYNIVDTAYVGRLGAEAIAALTFSFPIFFLLIAINSGIGTGMASIISRSLGAGKHKNAENAAMHGIAMSVVLAFIVFAAGWFSLEKLFMLFGAEANVIPLAMSYMRWILVGVFFMLPSYVMNSIFSSQGDTRTPVKVQVASLVLNIILDPIFIYGLDMGVAGAGLATMISFGAGVLVFAYYLWKKSELRLCWDCFSYDRKMAWEIVKIGAPASLMMIIMSIYVMFINRFMANYSTEHVAAFGLVARLESFAAMPIMAFSLAQMTLAGMFYGAGKYTLMKKTVRFGIIITALMTSAVGLFFFVFPNLFFRIFTSDPAILAIGAPFLRIDVFTFPLMAIAMSTSRVMQGMGYGLPGLIVNLTRIVFVAIPLGYVFVFVLGYGYLWVAYSMVAGGVMANIVGVTWLGIKFRNLKKEDKA